MQENQVRELSLEEMDVVGGGINGTSVGVGATSGAVVGGLGGGPVGAVLGALVGGGAALITSAITGK